MPDPNQDGAEVVKWGSSNSRLPRLAYDSDGLGGFSVPKLSHSNILTSPTRYLTRPF